MMHIGNDRENMKRIYNTRHENNVIKWDNDKLNKLYFYDVLKYLEEAKDLKETISKFSLSQEIKDMKRKLNDYVHGNGKKFYNKSLLKYTTEEIKELLADFSYKTKYIITSVVFLLSLINRFYILATDYTDALEVGRKPKEEYLLFVAPFIKDFFKKNSSFFGEGCYDYLKDVTGMDF
jgi:hypothetical protein